jgi:PTS system mannose-specific IIC component
MNPTKLSPQLKENTNKNIVGITACAAGIAHTYMAADALKQTGEKLGYNVRIETQGATGAETVLTDTEIKNADVVIIASDVKIDTSRFKGKRILITGVGAAIKDPQGLINRAYDQAKILDDEHNTTTASSKANTDMFATKKTGPLAHIMTGIS